MGDLGLGAEKQESREGHGIAPEVAANSSDAVKELSHSQPCSQAWRKDRTERRCCSQGEDRPTGQRFCQNDALTTTFPHPSDSPRKPTKKSRLFGEVLNLNVR